MKQASDDRLGSWKEIAVFLKRGIRTVQRWERSEGLPVHRHQHQKLGSVYALKSEVSVWWASRSSVLERQENTPPASGGTETTAGRTTRLLVLPFENLSGDPMQDYLADGFTEEMITQLARLRPERMAVIARTTASALQRGSQTGGSDRPRAKSGLHPGGQRPSRKRWRPRQRTTGPGIRPDAPVGADLRPRPEQCIGAPE